MSLSSLLLGVGLGLSLAAPPGPVNAVIAEESALRGWWAGFSSGLGALAADGVFFVATVAGLLSVVGSRPLLREGLGGLGGLLMLYIGYSVLLEAGEGYRGVEGAGRGFGRTFLVAAGNPYQLGWWLTAGLSFFESGGAPLVLGLFLGIVAWVACFPLFVVEGERRVDWFAPAVAYLSSAVLVLFGGFLLVDSLLPKPLFP